MCYFVEKKGHVKNEYYQFQESVNLQQSYQKYKEEKYNRRSSNNYQELAENSENFRWIDEDSVSLAEITQQESLEDNTYIVAEESSSNKEQVAQISATEEKTETNSIATGQLQTLISNKTEPQPDIERMPKDELSIYEYNTQEATASYVSKTPHPPDKNKDAEGFTTVISKKNRSKKGNTESKKDDTRLSPYKKTRGEENHTQI